MKSPKARADAGHIEQALRLFHAPGDVVEIRALNVRKGSRSVKTVSGYFDDFALAAAAGARLSGAADGVYFVLNQVNPALLARRVNRVAVAGSGETTPDRDILRRRWLLIDCDAKRPAKISATDDEVQAAVALAAHMAGGLKDRGWPDPVHALSGNGAHLLYRIDLPPDDGGLVQRVLEALAKAFNTEAVKVDTSVFNPARITKLYGTLARKGDETPDRPWRYSSCTVPDHPPVVVAEQQLVELAGKAAAPSRSRAGSNGVRTDFDLERWVQNWIPDARGPEPWSQGPRKWEIPSCPWNPDHDQGEAFVAELAGGGIAAGCHHESCTWGWHELRERLEPGYHRHRAIEAWLAAEYEETSPPDDDDASPDASATNGHGPNGGRQKQPVWRAAPEFVDEILSRASEAWVSLELAHPGHEIARIRPGGTVVVMGPSGAGKSSFVAGLLISHARYYGPAVYLSCELPGDEITARMIGMQCDASWEDVLRGRVRREYMEHALALPRLWIVERQDAHLGNLASVLRAARAAYPGQPLLGAVDYAQIMPSPGRENRDRVQGVMAGIDGSARGARAVMIAVNQMSRMNARAAKTGERLGDDTADLAAESATVERYASLTLSLGAMKRINGDGDESVLLSIGKGRMGGGDQVRPLIYEGRTGRYRIDGDARPAAEVRAEMAAKQDEKRMENASMAILGAASKVTEPIPRQDLVRLAKLKAEVGRMAIARLLEVGELVEVRIRRPRSQYWLVCTPALAAQKQLPLLTESPA